MVRRKISPRGFPFSSSPCASVYLRLSITEACNLHCRYCRPDGNAGGKAPHRTRPPLGGEALLRLAAAIQGAVPIRKLRFTGGEPLRRPGLPALVAAFRARFPGAEFCLTTNGMLLETHAAALRRAGVERLNISLDTLDPHRFRRLAGRPGLSRVLAGIEAARAADFRAVKLNAVLLRTHNGDRLPELVRFAAKKGCEIRFVELMPYGAGAHLFRKEFLPAPEARERLRAAFPYEGSRAPSDTAERHAFLVEGRTVTVGFITPMSHRFCGRCDRLRLDSTGRLFTCLREEEGVDLAARLREGGPEAVRETVRRTLSKKSGPAARWPRRAMVRVGG